MKISENYWLDFEVSAKDLESLYNYLLENETPLNKSEITKFIIDQVISDAVNQNAAEKLSGGSQYLPKSQYHSGDELVFPQFGWKKGKVITTRKGNNPAFPNLDVIDVEFSKNETKQFAANLEDHKLNEPIQEVMDPTLDPEFVETNYGDVIAERITRTLSANDDLVSIAGSFFPKALLVDVGVGHLNLCEAVLEMNNGGPLTTLELMKQVELPTDVNEKLTEFSMNYALQEDGRFDEVGPSGETLWFLKRLEPAQVQSTPLTLQYSGVLPDSDEFDRDFQELTKDLCDELEPETQFEKSDSYRLSLSYPHWRAGTLPLTKNLKNLFPTAYETPRVKFEFVDGVTHERLSGWVVRPSRYIYGLKEWYDRHGLIPGSIVIVNKGEKPGEVIIRVEKSRSNRDWIRTVLVGADGGVVFALLKQIITCIYDERMATMVPDVSAIDAIWNNPNKSRQPVEKVVQMMMRELGKLNPQGQIHLHELYAAVNIVRRVPPSIILDVLFSADWSKHLGDLYFKLNEA